MYRSHDSKHMASHVSAGYLVALATVTMLAWSGPSAGQDSQREGRGGPTRGGGRDQFLQRLDANGNGLLESSELEGRARSYVEQAAKDAGLDPSQPIPIDKLREAMNARFRGGRRGPGGSSRSGPEPGSGTGGEQTGDSPGEANKPGETAKPVPNVPGFGNSRAAPKAAGFGGRAKANPASGDGTDRQQVGPDLRNQVGSKGRKSYRFLSPIERLPQDLPDWFTRNDADGDGQVQMSEYASVWSDAKAAEFAKHDLNGDGIVTPKECQRAQRK